MENGFVSGLEGPPERQPSLVDALKKLEAGVKGYGVEATPATKARDARITNDVEGPFDGWLPIRTEDEMITGRLERYPLADTSNAIQLELPLAA